MLDLLREDEVGVRFRTLKKGAAEVAVAAPFWGEGALKMLGLSKAQPIRVLCNLGSNACNPHVIEKLVKQGHNVKTHHRLHAKLYFGATFAIVGSSNASTNGLTAEGDQTSGSIEANILTDDVAILAGVRDLFAEIWSASAKVNAARLNRAIKNWKNRPQSAVNLSAVSLLSACRERPELFSSVSVLPYEQPLGCEASKMMKKFKRQDVSVGDDATGGQIGASDFQGSVWGYQIEDEIPNGSWLIALSCKEKPKVYGASRVFARLKVKGEVDLTLTRRSVVTLPTISKPLRIPNYEKDQIVRVADQILRHSAESVPLPKVVKMIDKLFT